MCGVGCANFFQGAGPKPDFTDQLTFAAGDSFEVRPTLFGVGSSLADITSSTRNITYVTIIRFEAQKEVDLKWHKTEVKKIEEGEVLITGSLKNIDLEKTHTLFFPAGWSEGSREVAKERSGVWISDEAYQLLIKTGQAKMTLELEKTWMETAFKMAGDAQRFVATQRGTAADDPELLKREEEKIKFSVSVNGEAGEVFAIKAKNEYGEFIILDNPQNPLILKFTPNPFLTQHLFKKEQWQQKLTGFSLTKFELTHERLSLAQVS